MSIDRITLKSIKKDPKAFAESLTKSQLKLFIAELDRLYHEESNSPVSDEHYDVLRDSYNQRFAKLTKVGAPVTGERKVRLPVRMGSLDKFKPGSMNLLKFLSQGPFVVSDKEDGISLELRYLNGVPANAYTRGNGIIGKDVSGVIPALNIPHHISFKDELIIRAEFTADKDVFERHFSDEFATSRNLGGGLLNRNQPSDSVLKYKVIAYEVLKGPTAQQALTKQLGLLKQLGFTLVPFKVFPALTEEKLISLHNQRKTKAKRDIDGIVVARDIAYKIPQSGYPTHAYAFKINSIENSVVVKVKDVIWEESRLGRLIPRVLIEPTVIGGVKVSFFTGHNNYFIEHGHIKPKAGHPVPYSPRPINKGAEIRAIRSGDVIPYIMEVVKPARVPSKPDQPYIVEGVHLRAMHESKSDIRRIKELTHFFTALEVEGLKQGVITRLVENGFDTVKKILNLKIGKLLQLEGFQKTSAEKLVANLQAAKSNLTFVKVAKGSAAFGDKIGEARLAALEEAIPDLLNRVNLPERELVEAIQSVRGFKQLAVQIAQNLKEFVKFCERNGIELATTQKTEVTGDIMQGKVILFTSVRDAALQDWIIRNGGKIASTVKQANLLVIKEGASNNKTEYAQSVGIPIITLKEFKKKYKVRQND